jgi:hypothetical protein
VIEGISEVYRERKLVVPTAGTDLEAAGVTVKGR